MGEGKQDPTQSTKKKRFYHETNEAEASGYLAFLSPSQDQGMCSHGHCFPTFTEVKYLNHSYDDNHFRFDFPCHTAAHIRWHWNSCGFTGDPFS